MAKDSGATSFAEGLAQLASQAVRLATLPDADPKFCSMIAQAVIAKAREPHQAVNAAAKGGPGAPPGIGPQGMPGGAPGGSPANPAAPPLGAPSMGPGPSQGLSPQGNMDEIRRMMPQGALPG